MSGIPKEKRTDWSLYDDFLLENYIKLGAKKMWRTSKFA